MLMDVMKELREEGRSISIGRLFAITVNTKVHLFFLLPWPLTAYVFEQFKMLKAVSTSCPTRIFQKHC